MIQLDRFGYSSFAALQSIMTQAGNDTLLWLGPNDTVVLKNVAASSLSPANFAFTNVVPDLIALSAPATTVSVTQSVRPDASMIIFGGKGNDTLTGGTGSDTFVVSKSYGTDAITNFQSGTDGDLLRVENYGFTSYAAFMAAAHQVGANTVIALSGTESVTLNNVRLSSLVPGNVQLDYILPASGASTSWLKATTAGQVLNGTFGNDTITTASDQVTLAGGKGDDIYVVSDSQTQVIEKAGEGTDSVVSWNPNGYVLPNTSVENVTAGIQANTYLVGNDLANVVTGNPENNLISGGKGDDILVGGGGHDMFVIANGEGSDVITDFSAGITDQDRVRLDGFSFKSFADIKAAMHQVGTDVVLNLDSDQTLAFRNANLGDFSAKNFALPINTSGMSMTFDDEFNDFSRYTQGSGTWQTSFVWGGDSAYFSNQTEQQAFVDPDFQGLTNSRASAPLGLNPFSIQNGHLVITAAPVTSAVHQYLGNQQFTSGMISSESSFSQTYGYFEMKATLPDMAGAWPSFWMLPASLHAGAELDILEDPGSDPTQAHVNSTTNLSGEMNGAWVPAFGDLTAGDHTYGALWTPYYVTFYLDGNEVAQYATPENMNSAMYLIASFGVGGTWGGDAVPGTTGQMSIDYIRAYQLPEYTLAGYTLQTSATPVNTITGTSGVDHLVGTSGADLLNGNGGADTLGGGLGDDTYAVSNPGTVLTEGFGEGVDTVQSSMNWTLGANFQNLTLTGNASVNATGNSMSNIILGNIADNVITGGQGNDILTGAGGNDTFVIAKGDGSDIITDFHAGDHVELNNTAFTSFAEIQSAMTQVGADTYLKIDSDETLVIRNHTVGSFTSDDFDLPAIPALSSASIRWYTGTSGADNLYGTGANETFQGQGGHDIEAGGDGDDQYYVQAGTTVIEKPGQGIDTDQAWGSWTLEDNVENLIMNSAGTGTGNSEGNYIQGSGANDVINGKGGNDYLVGGAGNDSFIYEKNSGYDTIADFHVFTSAQAEHDTLKLVGYDASAYLTHQGDDWQIHYAGGVDTIHIAGVANLTSADFTFN
ncbi:MAG TPA: family 16 glycosylhydrolase [Devosiaceae bacterium]|nr:family 16 glycosylhydrolase [Devosiaceae bacterium]